MLCLHHKKAEMTPGICLCWGLTPRHPHLRHGIRELCQLHYVLCHSLLTFVHTVDEPQAPASWSVLSVGIYPVIQPPLDQNQHSVCYLTISGRERASFYARCTSMQADASQGLVSVDLVHKPNMEVAKYITMGQVLIP